MEFRHEEMSSASVLCLWVCKSSKLLSRAWDIVDRRYVFTLRRADALRLLTALVAGITIISFSIVHTSEMATRCAGESATMYALTSESVGFSDGDLELNAVVKDCS